MRGVITCSGIIVVIALIVMIHASITGNNIRRDEGTPPVLRRRNGKPAPGPGPETGRASGNVEPDPPGCQI